MGLFHHDDDEAKAHSEVTGSSHKAAISHELLAGAASYEASKAYEKYCEKNGKPESHAKAKELIASFSGAFIDRIIETKGLDFVDKEKAKHDAKARTEKKLASSGEY